MLAGAGARAGAVPSVSVRQVQVGVQYGLPWVRVGRAQPHTEHGATAPINWQTRSGLQYIFCPPLY